MNIAFLFLISEGTLLSSISLTLPLSSVAFSFSLSKLVLVFWFDVLFFSLINQSKFAESEIPPSLPHFFSLLLDGEVEGLLALCN